MLRYLDTAYYRPTCVKGAGGVADWGIVLRLNSRFYHVVDIFANSLEIFQNFRIRYSYYRQSVFFEKRRAFLIVRFSLFRIMFGTVEFDYQFRFRTIKVCNILSQNLLSCKSGDRILAQVIVPKPSFFFRHIFSQRFRNRYDIFIMLS